MKPGPRPVAVVRGSSETVQDLFATVSESWQSAGVKVVGVVAEPHGLPDRSCAAGILRAIPSGEAFPIYLDTAPAGTSCHLDASGVDAACASVLAQVRDADVVVLSKFGKLEAQGQGLWPVFQAALAAGRPIVTSVSGRHDEAWRALVADAAAVDATEAALAAWLG